MFARKAVQSIGRSAFFVSRRGMAGGSHAPPPPEGSLDAIVRKVLKEDEHVAMAILGLYGALILYATSGGKKKENAPVIAAPVAISTSEVPASDAPNFGDWVAADGNFEKFLLNLEK